MDKRKLINNLNADLSNELGAIIQYITYSAQVTGPFAHNWLAFFLRKFPTSKAMPSSWPTR
jgi:bacterioferritin